VIESAIGARLAAQLYHPQYPCANPGLSIKMNKQPAIRVKTVIASEANNPERRTRLDCFIASLLAMTREQDHG
jgi:hypothetical protein